MWVRSPSSAVEIEILNGRLDETEARMRQRAAQVPLLDRTRVVVGEAVDADDVGAVGEQPLGQRRSDEAGAAGDERLHESTPRTRAGNRQGRPWRSSVAWTVVPVARVAASAARTTS